MKIEKINDLIGHEGAIYALEESFDENKFYSAGFDNIVVEWDTESSQNPIAIAKLPSKAFSILKIEALNLLLVGTAQGGVHVININSKKEIKFLKVQTDMIFDLLYVADEKQLLVASADGTLAVWDANDWTLIKQVKLSNKKLRCIHPLDASFLVGCEDGTVKVLDAITFEQINEIRTHLASFGVNCIAISPDNKLMISGSRDGHLNVHNIEANFELINRIPAHNFAIYDIKYSPNLKHFVTASRDKSFKIWDATSFKVIQKLDYKTGGHKASVNAVLWTNKNRIITTGDDRTIKVWRINYL